MKEGICAAIGIAGGAIASLFGGWDAAPTGAHDAYNAGDKVTYNGKRYVCQTDGCVWDPETYPAG